ncbi:MAG: universal stress protein [Myxococcaceae bacterium]
MTVLAGIRFLEATQAAEAAAGLARRLKERLHLVHVLPAEAEQVPGLAAAAFVHGALTALAERVGAGLQVTVQVARGETHLGLLSAVAEQQASLLVVGRPPPEAGRGPGGTVERLSAACPVPMLVVPDPEPFTRWGEQRPLQVVVGVDGSRPTRAALALVERLARAGPVHFTAVRIVYPLYEARRLGLPLPVDYAELSPELAAALQREVEEAIAAVRASARDTRIRLHPSLGRTADPLVAEATVANADLLALGTHHRRALARLWSVSEPALRLSRMAVLTVPAPEATAEDTHGFHTVVAATDFSALGDTAVALGRAALQPGGTLHLVHVTKSHPSAAEEAALVRRLRSLVPDTAEVKVEAEVRVRQTPPGSDEASCILQTAERVAADLVAVGAGGHSTLRSRLLGSVAMKLLGSSVLPVLVARPPE